MTEKASTMKEDMLGVEVFYTDRESDYEVGKILDLIFKSGHLLFFRED